MYPQATVLSSPDGRRVQPPAPPRPRASSPIGQWMKSPVNGHRHPLVLKLAACLEVADPRSAIEHAYLVRDLLYAWSVEQTPRTGMVEDVGSRALAMLVGWRGDPDAFLGDLRRVGLVDRYGRLADWNFVTCAVSPQHELRLQDMVRQRTCRLKHDEAATSQLDGTRQHDSPDCDTGVTRHVTDLAALEECVPGARSETDSRGSLSGAARPMPLADGETEQATKASATRRSRKESDPMPVIPVPGADEALAQLPEAARLVTYRLRFIPDPVAAEAIAGEVGDDPDDLDTWDATLGKWATATKTGGGAYHRGPNALPALFERFRDNRRTRRDKLGAIMRRTAEAAAVEGDVTKPPDAIVEVSHVRHLTQKSAVEQNNSEVLTGTPDAGAPEYPQWFARLLEGMRAGTADGLALGLIANAKALTGDLGPGGTAVGIGVPATLLRMWRIKGLDVLALGVADRLGLTLTIGDAPATALPR